MTSMSRKRKFAGPRVQELKQVDQDPAKHGNKPKPREYVLHTITNISYYTQVTTRYPSKAAREQAMRDARKKNELRNKSERPWSWYKDYKSEVEFRVDEE